MSFVGEPQYATYDKKIEPFSFFGNLVKPKEENPVPELTFLGKHYAASWQPQAADNNKLLKTNEITTNAEYRKYMISKTIPIMEKNKKEYMNA
jgi:hypothetical protein